MRKPKNTKPLKLLMETFEQSSNAISLADLLEQLDQKMNRTTVYRILQRLEEGGTLHSFRNQDGHKWYAKCKKCSTDHPMDTHPHFQCRDCGKVECLTLDIASLTVPEYKIDSADLFLTGLCKDCLA